MSIQGDPSNLQLTGPATTIPILPQDVLERMSTYCFANELGSFLTVSRPFHQCAIQQLFLFVGLRREDYSKPDNDPFIFYSPITRTAPSLNGADPPILNMRFLSNTVPRGPLPPANHPAFINTRHLMLDLHKFKDCKSMEPLILPNLITLRIRSFPADDETCWFHRAASKSANPNIAIPVSIPQEERCCQLLSRVRPRRLIFGLTASDMSNPDPNFWQLSHPELIESVKEVMIILRMGRKGLGLFDDVPSTVQRLVIVISNCMAGWRKWGQGWGFDAGPVEAYDKCYRPKDMRRYIAMACTGNAMMVEIIGLETMVDVINENSIQRGRREVREELVSCLLEKGWARDKAEKRAEGLVFTNGV